MDSTDGHLLNWGFLWLAGQGVSLPVLQLIQKSKSHAPKKSPRSSNIGLQAYSRKNSAFRSSLPTSRISRGWLFGFRYSARLARLAAIIHPMTEGIITRRQTYRPTSEGESEGKQASKVVEVDFAQLINQIASLLHTPDSH